MKRQNFATGAKWENVVGYSRAVKIGNLVEVSGTVAVDEHGVLIGKDDYYAQTKFIIQKIEKVLQQAGAELKHVIRTRMFVKDISHWEAVGRAHGEFFHDIRPVTSMIEIKALISPEYLVEIEVTAMITD